MLCEERISSRLLNFYDKPDLINTSLITPIVVLITVQYIFNHFMIKHNGLKTVPQIDENPL